MQIGQRKTHKPKHLDALHPFLMAFKVTESHMKKKNKENNEERVTNGKTTERCYTDIVANVSHA
jgi:hypothetical protein